MSVEFDHDNPKSASSSNRLSRFRVVLSRPEVVGNIELGISFVVHEMLEASLVLGNESIGQDYQNAIQPQISWSPTKFSGELSAIELPG